MRPYPTTVGLTAIVAASGVLLFAAVRADSEATSRSASAGNATAGQVEIPGDWPQWRGPFRNGEAVGARLPEEWPSGPLPVKWRTPLGEGYSSPVIVGGRLYLHAREGEREVVQCLDAETGEELWRFGYVAPYEMHPAAKGHGRGPKATTTVAAGRVFAFGISSILSCLDAQTGELLWQRDLPKDFEGKPAEYGSSGSPLVDGDLVVVPVGGEKGGAVMGFRASSGEPAWKAVPGELPAMNAPMVAQLAEARQVITFTEKQLVGLERESGEVLWSYPYETPYRQNIVTPVIVGDRVIASGTGNKGFSLRIARDDKEVYAEEIWTNELFRLYMSSPVVVGEHVYGHNQRGQLVCVDVFTGETAWAVGNFGKYCSIVVVGERLLVLNDAGELVVVQADPEEYREVGRSTVSESQTWSHLAVVGNRLYVRDSEAVKCLVVGE